MIIVFTPEANLLSSFGLEAIRLLGDFERSCVQD